MYVEFFISSTAKRLVEVNVSVYTQIPFSKRSFLPM